VEVQTEAQESLLCAECGSVIPEGMEFCPACGKPVEAQEVLNKASSVVLLNNELEGQDSVLTESDEQKAGVIISDHSSLKCPACGEENPKGVNFCIVCGTSLASESGELTNCPNCGKEIPAGQERCPFCDATIFIDREEVQDDDSIIQETSLYEINEKTFEQDGMREDVEKQRISENTVHPCPNCGEEIPLGAKICEFCNATVFTEPSKLICPNCWKEVPAGTEFCIHCGSSMRVSPEARESADNDSLQVPDDITDVTPASDSGIISESNAAGEDERGSVSEPSKIRSQVICPRCGYVMVDKAKVCISCGMALRPGLDVEESEYEKRAATVLCPYCGLALPEGRFICSSCGYSLKSSVENSQDGVPPHVPSICRYCGMVLPVGLEVCPSCNTAVPENTEVALPNSTSMKHASNKPSAVDQTSVELLSRSVSPIQADGPIEDKPKKTTPSDETISVWEKMRKMPHNRLLLLIVGFLAIALVTTGAIFAYRLVSSPKPMSLDAQLTQISTTARPVATLPPALAKNAANESSPTPIEIQATAKPTKTKKQNTPQVLVSPSPIGEPVIASSPPCNTENGICAPGVEEKTATPPSKIEPLPSQTNLKTEQGITGTPTSQEENAPTPQLTTTLTSSMRTNSPDEAELVQIPSGEFIMGSDKTDVDYWGVEGPSHEVYLDSYWIYRNEVTNAMFQKCIDAGSCTKPAKTDLPTNHFGKPQYDRNPVVQITWEQAQAYCKWAGGILPTEAQWEKAARGTDGRKYPWGNEVPSGKLLNLCDKNCSLKEQDKKQDDGYVNTAPVGSFPGGASIYGVLDMAGNVWEWTADWYSTTYYKTSPSTNPTGPEFGMAKVIRGGSWSDKEAAQFRTAARQQVPATSTFDTLGFRCVIK